MKSSQPFNIFCQSLQALSWAPCSFKGTPIWLETEFWVRGKGGFILRWASFWPGMRLRKAEETQERGSSEQLPAQPASVWTPQQVAGCTLLGKVGLSPKGLGQSYHDWEDHLSSSHQKVSWHDVMERVWNQDSRLSGFQFLLCLRFCADFGQSLLLSRQWSLYV